MREHIKLIEARGYRLGDKQLVNAYEQLIAYFTAAGNYETVAPTMQAVCGYITPGGTMRLQTT
jgi:hypothetical protein